MLEAIRAAATRSIRKAGVSVCRYGGKGGGEEGVMERESTGKKERIRQARLEDRGS